MSDRPEAGAFTVLDGIGAVLALGGTLFCWQLPFFTAPAYARMFQEFGARCPPSRGSSSRPRSR